MAAQTRAGGTVKPCRFVSLMYRRLSNQHHLTFTEDSPCAQHSVKCSRERVSCFIRRGSHNVNTESSYLHSTDEKMKLREAFPPCKKDLHQPTSDLILLARAPFCHLPSASGRHPSPCPTAAVRRGALVPVPTEMLTSVAGDYGDAMT